MQNLEFPRYAGFFLAQARPGDSNACPGVQFLLWNIPGEASQFGSAHSTTTDKKHSLMKLSSFIINLLVIAFFALISYGLTGSIAVRSTMGIILAL